MKIKTKVVITIVLLSLLVGVILYSEISARIAKENNKKQAEESFAKVWYSDESVKEREDVLKEIEEIGDKWNK